MTSERDRLDVAIGVVAARMVHVDDDAALALRIAGALPERSRFGWLMPRLAILTTMVVAAIVWTMRPPSAPVGLLPASPVNVLAALRAAALPREPGIVVRTRPLEPLESLEPMEPMELVEGDFEGSLPSVSVTSLAIAEVQPGAIVELAPIDLPSLAIPDLTLTAESFPQKEE
jgi:hypothetical protein